MKIVKALWEEILDIMEEKISGFSIDSLEAGVRVSRFKEVEDEMNLEIPEELKQLYSLNNGTFGLGAILGFELMTFDDMYLEWKNNKKNDINETKDIYVSNPQGAIRNKLVDSNWIPFAFNNEHTYLAIDLNPNSEGKVGQIINFGESELDTEKYVIANSLEELLRKAIMVYEYNGLYIEEGIEVQEGTEDENENLIKFMDKHLFNIVEYYKSARALYDEDTDLDMSYNLREYDDYVEEDGYDSYEEDDDYYGISTYDEEDRYDYY